MHPSKQNIHCTPSIEDQSNFSIARLAQVLLTTYEIEETDMRVWQLAQGGEGSVQEILEHWIEDRIKEPDLELAGDLVRFLCRRFENLYVEQESVVWTR